MADVKLDAVAVWPFEPMHPEVVAQHGGVRRDGLVVIRAEHQQSRVAKEDQVATRSQHPRRLRNPAIRIGPDRGAVLGEHNVKRPVPEREMLCDAVDKGER